MPEPNNPPRLASSIESQRLAVGIVAQKLRPDEMVQAGLAGNLRQAEMLRSQLQDASATFDIIAGDERIRRAIVQRSKQ